MNELNYIQVNKISKSYGGLKALEATSLSIKKGERIALIGPSGAGKSTMLGILSGLTPPDTGDFSIEGMHILGMKAKEKSKYVGIIRQQFDLVGPMKVVHNVLAGNLGRWSLLKSLLSLVYPQSIDEAHTALSKVGIENKLYEMTSNLSGGEQQRVALARLFVQNPKLVLADEPVASLDPSRSEQILSLLVDLTKEGDQTLVASLHSIDLARKYFSRIIGIQGGSVLFDVPVNQLKDSDIQSLYELEPSHGK